MGGAGKELATGEFSSSFEVIEALRTARDQYASGNTDVTSTSRTSPNHHLFSTGLPPLPSILLPILAILQRLLASYAAVRRLPSIRDQNIEQISLAENYGKQGLERR